MASHSTPQSRGSPSKPESYRHDVFISSSPGDAEWVRDWMIPKLQKANLKICVPDDCFEPGAPILQETERAIRESRRILIVLSPTWVEGEWSNLEATLSQSRDPGARWRRVIPLLVTPCEPPDSIKLLHWVDLTSAEKREQQVERIVAAIQGKSTLPELQLSAFPEARVRRLELRWYSIAGIFAILTLVVLVGWIYFQYSGANPTSMPNGTFNIAVADFMVVDSAGKPIADSAVPAGARDAREQVLNLSTYLTTEKQELEEILGQSVTIWGPERGIRPIERGTEEKRAEDLNAHVVIYGTLQQNDVNRWNFDPAFYLRHNPLDTADELNGEHRLGAPLPYLSGQIASKREVNTDLQARMKALSRVILALSQMNVDTPKGYRDAEEVLQNTAVEFESSGANEGKGLDVIYLFLGNAYIGESNLESDPEKRQGLLDKAVESFKTAISKNAKYPRAYNGLGSAYFQQAHQGTEECAWDWDRLELALEAHSTALDLPTDSKPPSGYVDLRANFGIGRVYYYRGYCLNPLDWDLAENHYGKALELYRATPKLYLYRLASIGYTDFATMALYRSGAVPEDQAPALRAKAIEHYMLAKNLALKVKTPGSLEQAIGTMPFLLITYCLDGQTGQAQKALDEFVAEAQKALDEIGAEAPDSQSIRSRITAIPEVCVK